MLALAVAAGSNPLFARGVRLPTLTAKSAVVMDARSGNVLYSKNPHLRLPPASTTKLMTALVTLERLPLDKWVSVSRRAAGAAPSRAGLTLNAQYRVRDLLLATLVSSSNDAAVALAEAAAGSEGHFAELMNEKASQLGMNNTRFVNATGLPEERRLHYSTAFDLSLLMRCGARDPRIDEMMGFTTAVIRGSDGRPVFIKNHNKMLWRTPGFVKGKTGWTFASRHTFVGTDYSSDKKIAFAMLSSRKPWIDIERLAAFGLLLMRGGKAHG